MKKTWIMLLSMLLILAMAGTTALASNSNTGASPEYIQSLMERNTNQTPYNPAPSQSGGDTSTTNNSSSSSSPQQNAAGTFLTESPVGGSYAQAGSSGVTIIGNEGGGSSAPEGGDIVTIDSVTGGPIIVAVGEDASGSGSSSSGVQTLDWYSVGFDLINANKSITVKDLNTGVTWSGTYINGKNHADVIPASSSDAQKLSSNSITGSYVRRPVVVTIGGTQYAGSMYAVGHGETNYCDYFKGVMCIHFTGSQTHGSGKVDSDHQNAIKDALNGG